jgi:hypothetical protein
MVTVTNTLACGDVCGEAQRVLHNAATSAIMEAESGVGQGPKATRDHHDRRCVHFSNRDREPANPHHRWTKARAHRAYSQLVTSTGDAARTSN